MANVSVYKQSEVIFYVAGIPVTDLPEEGSISVTYDRERITKQIDTERGGLFSWRRGKPASIEISILPHSPWIAYLMNLRNLGQMVPIGLQDKNKYSSKIKFGTMHAMIQDPEVSYGADAEPIKFKFEIIQLDDITANLSI